MEDDSGASTRWELVPKPVKATGEPLVEEEPLEPDPDFIQVSDVVD